MAKVSIIMPVFNEVGSVESTAAAIRRKVDGVLEDWELIIVDDGSSDGTDQVVGRISDENVRVLRHSVNRGYGAALKTGILSARHELALIIDGDGSYPVEPVPDMVAAMRDKDMVVAARNRASASQDLLRRLAKAPIHWLANYLVSQRIPDLNSGLRIFSVDLAKKFLHILPNGFSFTSNITLALLSEGYRVEYLPIAYHKRVGRSKVRPFHDGLNYFILVVRMILLYNPLKVLAPVAALFFTGSIVTLVYDIAVLENLTDKSVIFFTASVQVALLGLLADLINRRASR